MLAVIAIAAAAGAPGRPLTHFWSKVVGAGRANEGLRADWQRQLAEAHRACGFEYVRFHGLFHDDMFVYTERDDGTPVYNFQYVDALFDALLEMGVRPFVEFGFSPRALARQTATVFWWGAHGSPPTNLAKWAELVRRTVVHWMHRYGRDEVRRWYFEVWNEPNLRGFFAGTRSEYFELYAVTARAVKHVDGALRVGGPATSNFVPDARFDTETEDFAVAKAVTGLDDLDWRPVWLEAFLEHCARTGLPVDFVSTHPYPTDWALDEHGQGQKLTRGVDATPTDLARIRAIVAASPFPAAEIHLTEWNSSSSPRDHTHDTVPAATFIVRSVLKSLGTVDSLAYWTFTDVFEEGGAGEELFHGGFGLLTLPGIPKPAFHAYTMLHELGDELVAVTDGAVVTRRSGSFIALMYHYPREEPRSVPASFDDRTVAERIEATGSDEPVELVLDGLAPGATFAIETLDVAHGNAIAAWTALGAPRETTREQQRRIDRAARATQIDTVGAGTDGVLRVTATLRPWSIMLVKQIA
jgi:xylan 1,4-beta-xylosidase